MNSVGLLIVIVFWVAISFLFLCILKLVSMLVVIMVIIVIVSCIRCCNGCGRNVLIRMLMVVVLKTMNSGVSLLYLMLGFVKFVSGSNIVVIFVFLLWGFVVFCRSCLFVVWLS